MEIPFTLFSNLAEKGIVVRANFVANIGRCRKLGNQALSLKYTKVFDASAFFMKWAIKTLR